MIKKKQSPLKVRLDSRMDLAFRRIIKHKKTTIQNVLEKIVKKYVLENVDIIIEGGKDNDE